jgi:hypothetical protein
MFVSLFGQLDYQNPEGLRQWLQAHAVSHRSILNAARDKGYYLQSALLNDEDLNGDWFARHGIAHSSLSRVYLPSSTQAGSILFGNDWQSEQGFYNWHQLHDAMHARLNSALGVN